MTRLTVTRTILTLAMLSLVAACGSDGDPAADGGAVVTMRMALTASEPPEGSAPGAVAFEDEAGTPFTIESAQAYVRHIQLDLPAGQSCAEQDLAFQDPVSCEKDKIEISGPFLVDLIEGTSQPSLAALRIPAGDYRRIDVRFDDADPDEGLVGDAQTLADHTMHAIGDLEHDGSDMTFELLLKFNEDARFEAPEGIVLGEGEAREALLMLDVSKWFQALPVTDCMTEGDLTIEDGTLLIDDERSQCSAIENTLKDTIKNSGQLQGA
ncbi:MAG: hypothetical protein OXU20_29595 [Myxococcales bacterium]|nr:hypothetical protein [Myxococcales bacterium]